MSQCLLYTAACRPSNIGIMRPTVSEKKRGSQMMFARLLHICMSPEEFVQNASSPRSDSPRSGSYLSKDPCSDPSHGTLVTSVFVH